MLRLRPLTGADELALPGTDAAAAMALLERLAGPAIYDLTVFQADRALAAVYDMLYGSKADCRAVCEACSENYQFTLDLQQIIAEQDADRPLPEPDGTWTLPEGARVRAPKPSDLGNDLETTAKLLTVEGKADPELVGTFLEKAAPVLTLDLVANCPHCGASANLRFDLAVYLPRRIASEHPFLIRETHLIASRYGWSHDEIMSLTREDRRAYAGLIEAERVRHSRGQTR